MRRSSKCAFAALTGLYKWLLSNKRLREDSALSPQGPMSESQGSDLFSCLITVTQYWDHCKAVMSLPGNRLGTLPVFQIPEDSSASPPVLYCLGECDHYLYLASSPLLPW